MPAKLTAVLGNCKRRGRWKIRSHTKALVLFGNCNIDYRDAYADDELEEIKLDVLCVFGRAVFTLPPGADVQPSAVSMLSSSKFDVEVTTIKSELPSIKMETTTVFGMCRVQTVDHPPEDPETTTFDGVDMIGGEASGGDRSVAPELESALPPIPLAEGLDVPVDPISAPRTAVPPTEIAMGDERVLEEHSPFGQSRIDDLDPAKAVSITEETETVHVGLGLADADT